MESGERGSIMGKDGQVPVQTNGTAVPDNTDKHTQGKQQQQGQVQQGQSSKRSEEVPPAKKQRSIMHFFSKPAPPIALGASRVNPAQAGAPDPEPQVGGSTEVNMQPCLQADPVPHVAQADSGAGQQTSSQPLQQIQGEQQLQGQPSQSQQQPVDHQHVQQPDQRQPHMQAQAGAAPPPPSHRTAACSAPATGVTQENVPARHEGTPSLLAASRAQQSDQHKGPALATGETCQQRQAELVQLGQQWALGEQCVSKGVQLLSTTHATRAQQGPLAIAGMGQQQATATAGPCSVMGEGVMVHANGGSDSEAIQDAVSDGGDEVGQAHGVRASTAAAAGHSGAGWGMGEGLAAMDFETRAAAAAAAAVVAIAGKGLGGSGDGEEVEVGGRAEPEDVQPVSELTPEQAAAVNFARVTRRFLEAQGMAPGSVTNCKQLLTSGGLINEVVEYRRREHGIKVVVGAATITPSGLLRCLCSRCKANQDFTLSVFETHCNSNYKKPADFLFLTAHDLSLKELLQLVQGVEVSRLGNIYLPLKEGSGPMQAIRRAPAKVPAKPRLAMSPPTPSELPIWVPRPKGRPKGSGSGASSQTSKPHHPPRPVGRPRIHKKASSSSSDEAPRVKRRYTKRAQVQAPEPEGGMAARRAAPGAAPPTHCAMCLKVELQAGQLQSCKNCNHGFHLACLHMGKAPEGDWFCPACITAEALATEGFPLPAPKPKVRKPRPLPAGMSWLPAPIPLPPPPPFAAPPPIPPSAPPEVAGAAAAATPFAAPPSIEPSSGRIRMSMPSQARVAPARQVPRSKNKHWRLFQPGQGSLTHGQPVVYVMYGKRLLEGTIYINPKGASGVLCSCCNTIISPSTFEAHAGQKQRRNPYDGIMTADGVSLRELASRLPRLPEESPPAPAPAPEASALPAPPLGIESIMRDVSMMQGGRGWNPYAQEEAARAAAEEAAAAAAAAVAEAKPAAEGQQQPGEQVPALESLGRPTPTEAVPLVAAKQPAGEEAKPAVDAAAQQPVKPKAGAVEGTEAAVDSADGAAALHAARPAAAGSAKVAEPSAALTHVAATLHHVRLVQVVLTPTEDGVKLSMKAAHPAEGAGGIGAAVNRVMPVGEAEEQAAAQGVPANPSAGPSEVPPPAREEEELGSTEETHKFDCSAITSSCVVCFDSSFEKVGFSDRTVLICDQCEREYHVGCLRKTGRGDLTAIPEGDWFCSDECRECNRGISVMLSVGEMPVGDDGYTIRFMRGKDGTALTSRMLHTVLETLQESFDPIISPVDGHDLLPSMVMAWQHGDSDFQGMISVLLRHRGKPVCAAIIRVFGQSLVELPLVATRLSARRQGHCSVLMDAIEQRMKALGVRIMALPATHDATRTWITGFGFRFMDPVQLQCAQAELRLLIFPGAQVLYRNVGPVQGATFTSVGNAAPMLLAAYPDALPEPVQECVEQQRQVIAMEAASHGFRLEGYPEIKPPPPQPGQLPPLNPAGWVSPPGWEGLQAALAQGGDLLSGLKSIKDMTKLGAPMTGPPPACPAPAPAADSSKPSGSAKPKAAGRRKASGTAGTRGPLVMNPLLLAAKALVPPADLVPLDDFMRTFKRAAKGSGAGALKRAAHKEDAGADAVGKDAAKGGSRKAGKARCTAASYAEGAGRAGASTGSKVSVSKAGAAAGAGGLKRKREDAGKGAGAGATIFAGSSVAGLQQPKQFRPRAMASGAAVVERALQQHQHQQQGASDTAAVQHALESQQPQQQGLHGTATVQRALQRQRQGARAAGRSRSKAGKQRGSSVMEASGAAAGHHVGGVGGSAAGQQPQQQPASRARARSGTSSRPRTSKASRSSALAALRAAAPALGPADKAAPAAGLDLSNTHIASEAPSQPASRRPGTTRPAPSSVCLPAVTHTALPLAADASNSVNPGAAPLPAGADAAPGNLSINAKPARQRQPRPLASQPPPPHRVAPSSRAAAAAQRAAAAAVAAGQAPEAAPAAPAPARDPLPSSSPTPAAPSAAGQQPSAPPPATSDAAATAGGTTPSKPVARSRPPARRPHARRRSSSSRRRPARKPTGAARARGFNIASAAVAATASGGNAAAGAPLGSSQAMALAAGETAALPKRPAQHRFRPGQQRQQRTSQQPQPEGQQQQLLPPPSLPQQPEDLKQQQQQPRQPASQPLQPGQQPPKQRRINARGLARAVVPARVNSLRSRAGGTSATTTPGAAAGAPTAPQPAQLPPLSPPPLPAPPQTAPAGGSTSSSSKRQRVSAVAAQGEQAQAQAQGEQAAQAFIAPPADAPRTANPQTTAQPATASHLEAPKPQQTAAGSSVPAIHPQGASPVAKRRRAAESGTKSVAAPPPTTTGPQAPAAPPPTSAQAPAASTTTNAQAPAPPTTAGAQAAAAPSEVPAAKRRRIASSSAKDTAAARSPSEAQRTSKGAGSSKCIMPSSAARQEEVDKSKVQAGMEGSKASEQQQGQQHQQQQQQVPQQMQEQQQELQLHQKEQPQEEEQRAISEASAQIEQQVKPQEDSEPQ